MKVLGKHTIVEFYDCNPKQLADLALLERALAVAAESTGASVIKSTFHEFSPHGVTGVVIIAESHLSIHTWPEYNYAAVDIFTCGTVMDNHQAIKYLKQVLEAGFHSVIELKRGILPYKAANLLPTGVNVKRACCVQKASDRLKS